MPNPVNWDPVIRYVFYLRRSNPKTMKMDHITYQIIVFFCGEVQYWNPFLSPGVPTIEKEDDYKTQVLFLDSSMNMKHNNCAVNIGQFHLNYW